MDKSKMRRVFKEKRDAADNKGKDAAILSRLCGVGAYLNARAVFTYVSVGSEAGTRGIIADALSRGKRVAVPKIIGKHTMQFYWIEKIGKLIPNNMGILEPAGGEVATPRNDSIFIVPGLVFSETMNRIGYGGGFYDAYLAGSSVIKIGLCYEFQMVKGLQSEPWDVKMDYIVTDKRVVSK